MVWVSGVSQAAQAVNMRQAAAVGAADRGGDPVVWPELFGGRWKRFGLRPAQRTQIARQAQARAGRAGLFQKLTPINGLLHKEWSEWL